MEYKIYLVERKDNPSYCDYISTVVVAKSIKDAYKITPCDKENKRSWTNKKNLKVKYLGKLNNGLKFDNDIIQSSYGGD